MPGKTMSHEEAQIRKAQRLFVTGDLGENREVELSKPQAHYLRNVLRLEEGALVRLFNGRDGEWLCRLNTLTRKAAAAQCEACLRPQESQGDLHYLFAPLKHARLDYMVQKATEMGASVLQPVQTDFTQVSRVNAERMAANAMEAAEQCNLLSVPEIRSPVKLLSLLETWDSGRRLIYCDEASHVLSPLEALGDIEPGPLALIVGPEGGFSDAERQMLKGLDFVSAISLGPRIMRADTAAVAALAVVQAVLGDWR